MKNKPITLLAAIILIAVGFLTAYTSKTSMQSEQYEWKQITVIESVVAAGMGRSRMISTDSDGKMQEEKLDNLFSAVGINFGNIKNNDLKITDRITSLSNDGWELFDVNTGVAMYGADNSDGIFMTRYMFRRQK